jgi:hypothetical protein
VLTLELTEGGVSAEDSLRCLSVRHGIQISRAPKSNELDGREHRHVREYVSLHSELPRDRTSDLIYPIPEPSLSSLLTRPAPFLQALRAYDNFLDYVSQTVEQTRASSVSQRVTRSEEEIKPLLSPGDGSACSSADVLPACATAKISDPGTSLGVASSARHQQDYALLSSQGDGYSDEEDTFYISRHSILSANNDFNNTPALRCEDETRASSSVQYNPTGEIEGPYAGPTVYTQHHEILGTEFNGTLESSRQSHDTGVSSLASGHSTEQEEAAVSLISSREDTAGGTE